MRSRGTDKQTDIEDCKKKMLLADFKVNDG